MVVNYIIIALIVSVLLLVGYKFLKNGVKAIFYILGVAAFVKYILLG